MAKDAGPRKDTTNGTWWFVVDLATTGCRRGEALGLRWRDVDFERRVVAIRQELIPLTKPSGVGREGRLIPRTKSERPRVIELDGPTITALRAWRVQQAKERLLVGDGYADRDLVFCWPDGRPYTLRRSRSRSTARSVKPTSPIYLASGCTTFDIRGRRSRSSLAST